MEVKYKKEVYDNAITITTGAAQAAPVVIVRKDVILLKSLL